MVWKRTGKAGIMKAEYYIELSKKLSSSEKIFILLAKEVELPFLPYIGMGFDFGKFGIVNVECMHWNDEEKKLCIFFENLLGMYSIASKEDIEDMIDDLKKMGFN